VVNGFHAADVSCPVRSANLVVSERVMRRLEPLRANFLFLPVTFEKVFRLPWSLDGEHDSELPAAVAKCLRQGRVMRILAICLHDQSAAAAQGQRSTDRPYSSSPVDLVKG
jgi:hypothetical protein